jgi:hypothetical protein
MAKQIQAGAFQKLDKSKLPPDLESLVPDYLAAIPSEPEGAALPRSKMPSSPEIPKPASPS